MPDDDRFPRYLSPAWRKVDQWLGIVSEFPPIMDIERIAPAQLTRLYGACVREWEALDLASFGLIGERSAALCETKSDQS
jgi:hypothetical protein